jgi:hypothetical protein
MSSLLRFSCLVALMVVLSSSIKQPLPSISGLWSVHWVESDIEEIDTLRFEQKNDSLFVFIQNKEDGWAPQFSKVKFDGSILTFQMDVNNITNFYTFQLAPDQLRFEGKVHTWRGFIFKIHLDKELH